MSDWHREINLLDRFKDRSDASMAFVMRVRTFFSIAAQMTLGVSNYNGY
jgi:hypothetical protein